MSLAQLLLDLAARGIRLEASGDRLRFHPRSAVTPELIERLRDHKESLLAVLRGQEQSTLVGASAKGDADRATPGFEWRESPTTCSCHEPQRFWRSIFGPHLICGICHPPATSDIVTSMKPD